MPDNIQRWDELREQDLSRRIIAAAKPSHGSVVGAFAAWLADDRGLGPATIRWSLPFAFRFLARVAGDADPVVALRELGPEAVESFFVDLARETGRGAQRAFRTVVRRLLRFAVDRGWVGQPLLEAVPGLRTYRLAHLVRGIEDEQIRHLLESVPDTSEVDVRDLAILVMLAVYGVRGGQVRALRMEEVHWKERRIAFPAHKGGKPVLHALVPQVASALARYLREVRPAGPYHEIFLRCRRPYTPLTKGALSQMVRSRLSHAGITTSSKGAHIFRHAFATRLLRVGHPLKTIADLLGHRDLGSVAIYTKVDEPSLREVAAEWPEVIP